MMSVALSKQLCVIEYTFRSVIYTQIVINVLVGRGMIEFM